MHITYLIGEPGVGKSSICTAAMSSSAAVPLTRPFKHLRYIHEGVTYLGHRVGPFPGTDQLSMSIQPVVLDWMRLPEDRLILAEGDRLANGKFFTAVREIGWDLSVIRVDCAEDVAIERRARRAAATGSKQDETWLKGRRTKVANLAPHVTHTVDSTGYTPAELAAQLADVDPVFNAFRR